MVLSIIWSKKKDSCKWSEEEGLRILVKLENGNSSKFSMRQSSKILAKPAFSLNQIISSMCSSDDNDNDQNYCFLKSCHLCHKHLNLDKEVYMYKGDLGFCSVECREKQIYMDEKEEIEISTAKMLASIRQRRRVGGRRCETSGLDDFLERRKTFSSKNERVIFL